jgi:hypothetical protein
MNSRRSVGLAIAVVLGTIASFAAGAWFATHYRIVPIREASPLDPVAPPDLELPSASVRDGSRPATSALRARSGRSPLGFRFTPNERLEYELSSQVTGQGFESTGPAGIRLGVSGDISMVTDRVDESGAAEMTVAYERMQVSGDFMGSPFRLDRTPERTTVDIDGHTRIDTRDPEHSSRGVPQLEFLEDPLKLRVAPSGEVLHVSGGAGWGEMLKEIPVLMPLEFPDAELQTGLQWESNFTMPLPGAGAPVRARARNTVVGYEYVGNRTCAVIRQDIDSRETDGVLTMPDSTMGSEMQFGMPLFELQGTNYIYFDIQRGQLVHTTSDLQLALKIGRALSEISSIFERAADDLAAVLGGASPGTGASNPLEDTSGLDLILDIDSTMTLKGVVPTLTARTPHPPAQHPWPARGR